MTAAEARAIERDKYVDAYNNPSYGMGAARFRASSSALADLPLRSTLLDVGCGRGEMLDFAHRLGFEVRGCEVVPALIDNQRVIFGEAHALPFGADSFDVVTLWDVIEHLRPDDTAQVLAELARVARKHVLITAANYSSRAHPGGPELHINRRDYDVWDGIFRHAFAGALVNWLPPTPGCRSECWRIDLRKGPR